MSIRKPTIIVGVSGGIAACKIPELLKLLVASYTVRVIVTHSAAEIINTNELELITQHAVYRDLFDKRINAKKILEKRTVEHIALANSASVFVVAPATANLLSKIAQGIADDYLTTTILAAICPVILCPSMNVYMWNNPVTQQNIKKLEKLGYRIIHPDSGMLACGYVGEGKLAKLSVIADEVRTYVTRGSSLVGKKIIVTSGGTIEPIDAVRFVTNKASGKMGAAIAESLWLRGASVLYVCSPQAARPRYIIDEKIFETADDLERILHVVVPAYDAIFHTAAVSDFTIANTGDGKMDSDHPVRLLLQPRKKIIDVIKQWNQHIQLFGFKAVWNKNDAELISIAKEKLKVSNADAIIVNDVSRPDQGFMHDTNEVFVVTKDMQSAHIPLKQKAEVAEEIVTILFS